MPPIRRRRCLQFSIGSIFVLTFVVSAFLAIGPHVRAYRATQELSNSNLHVSGNIFGLIVSLDDDAADTLRQLGTTSNRWLLVSLSDRSKFAAAHKLLAEINYEESKRCSPFWTIDLAPFARESNDFDDELIPGLVDFWNKVLDKSHGFNASSVSENLSI